MEDFSSVVIRIYIGKFIFNAMQTQTKERRREVIRRKVERKESTDTAIISARTDSLMDEPVGPFPLVARNCFFEASFSPHSRRSTRLSY